MYRQLHHYVPRHLYRDPMVSPHSLSHLLLPSFLPSRSFRFGHQGRVPVEKVLDHSWLGGFLVFVLNRAKLYQTPNVPEGRCVNVIWDEHSKKREHWRRLV